MNKAALSSYRKRLILLAIIGVLLMGVFVKKKLAPSWNAWRQIIEWRKEARSLEDIEAERNRIATRLDALDKMLGSADDNSTGWQSILDHLAKGKEISQVSLAGVAEEHVIVEDGLQIRTLPLSIKGRTSDLINAIGGLERNADDLHLLAVDLQVKEVTYNKPRQLTATLYLQTLSQ